MPPPATNQPASRPDSRPASPWPVVWAAGFTVAAWLVGAVWPGLLLTFGISNYGKNYLDSYAVLAALDAVRAGIDPHAFNPLDVMLRPHVYSDWWLALRWLGLTRENNFLVGTGMAGAFAVTAWVTMRPRNLREAVWLVALLVSPSVMLVVNRANNDLIIFVLLAGCSLAAAPVLWRSVVAVVCLWLATGLKYFPASAVPAFLWIRPVRRMPGVVLAALVVAGLALTGVWDEIGRSRFLIKSGVYTMGAPMLWRDRGWTDTESLLPGLVVVAGAALVLVGVRATMGLAERGAPQERLLAALGAVVLLTCFLVGMNYSYRWVFLLWPSFWLWRQAADSTLPGRQRWAARLACALAMVCLWGDGCLCASINIFNPYHSPAWQEHVLLLWRLWTQPLHWLLMILLAGWLVEGALATGREWWSLRQQH